MRTFQGSFAYTALLAAVLAAGGVFSSANAQTAAIDKAPQTGLGQAWPDAPDVSTNPHWHAYVFMLHGIKYVQINDLNGTVHAAVAMVGNVAVALPIGIDSRRIVERTQSAAIAQSLPGAETVYSDGTMTLVAVPQNNGATRFYLENICTDPYTCSAGGS